MGERDGRSGYDAGSGLDTAAGLATAAGLDLGPGPDLGSGSVSGPGSAAGAGHAGAGYGAGSGYGQWSAGRPGRHRADGGAPMASPGVSEPYLDVPESSVLAPRSAGFDAEPLFASLAARYPGTATLYAGPAERGRVETGRDKADRGEADRGEADRDAQPQAEPAHPPQPSLFEPARLEPASAEPATGRPAQPPADHPPAGQPSAGQPSAEPALHFSGPRFEPLPTSGPAYDAPTAWSLEPFTDAPDEPQPADTRSADVPGPLVDPDPVPQSGRHRADAAPLGRHRADAAALKGHRGLVHSLSGRAVFATAIATALTAGGVGAAATLPNDIGTHGPVAQAVRNTAHAATTRTATMAAMHTTATNTAAGPARGNRLPVRTARATRTVAKKATHHKLAAKTSAGKARHHARSAARRATAPRRAAATRTAAPTHAATPAATPAAPQWVRPGTGYISSGYGPRWGSFHYGIDLAAPYGAPIYAAGDGVVLRTGPATGFGDAIYIQHANGDTTVYGHEETTLVHPGEHVKAGQLIARVGAEGQATGPHLHFEVHQGSEYGPRIDPGPWLAARGVHL